MRFFHIFLDEGTASYEGVNWQNQWLNLGAINSGHKVLWPSISLANQYHQSIELMLFIEGTFKIYSQVCYKFIRNDCAIPDYDQHYGHIRTIRVDILCILSISYPAKWTLQNSFVQYVRKCHIVFHVHTGCHLYDELGNKWSEYRNILELVIVCELIKSYSVHRQKTHFMLCMKL